MIEPEILVDVSAGMLPRGGIGRFVRQLMRALDGCPEAPRHRYLITRDLRARASLAYPRVRFTELPLPWRAHAAAILAGAALGWRFDGMYGDAAVVHSPAGYGPRFRRARLINHVHDITYRTNPEWHTRKTSALQSAAAPVACRDASVVLTDCEFVRGQVIDCLGVAPERVLAIPLPLDAGFLPLARAESTSHVSRRFGIEGPFVLHVSTIEPRKNQVRLIGAYEALRDAGFPGPLLLVGHDGWRIGPILARIASSPRSRDIRRISDIDDRDLVALYGAATFTAFPSLAEGFGYPLLESMACGTPCIISDHPALLELAAGAAPAVPALDTQGLAEAMIRLWRDDAERARFSEAGLQRASAFTFDNWAAKMFAVYRRELEASARPAGKANA
jgi:glycosyltransferase involved in cell wall biosynthesis